MINKKPLSPIKILTLGAINGLLIGLPFEKARIAFLNYEMSQASREDAQMGRLADYIEARWEPYIPLVCIAVFAVVAYIVYRYFMSRPTLLLLVWFGLGAVAVGAGYFMATSTPDVFSFLWVFSLVAVSYVVNRLWKSHPVSLSLLWPVNGISAVIATAFAVQLVGMFFYWPELFFYLPKVRSPLLWLLFLLGVVLINVVYGAVIQRVFLAS